MYGSVLVVRKAIPLSLVGALRVANEEREDCLQLKPLGCEIGDG